MESVSQDSPVRVLVADDNTDAVEVMRYLFQSLGCDVQVAADGREVIEVAPKFEPELVVLDIQMPEIDGCQAARTLRQQTWAMGAIFVAYTAATGRQIADRIKRSGFQECFSTNRRRSNGSKPWSVRYGEALAGEPQTADGQS